MPASAPRKSLKLGHPRKLTLRFNGGCGMFVTLNGTFTPANLTVGLDNYTMPKPLPGQPLQRHHAWQHRLNVNGTGLVPGVLQHRLLLCT